MSEKKLSGDQAKLKLCIRAKDANEKLLISKPNVIGLDVGYRIKGGKVTDEQVVTVYVTQKLEKSELAKEHIIPTKIKIDDKEIPVDVVEGEIYRPDLFTLHSRPLRGGSSIGMSDSWGTGTGGVCVTRNDGRTYLLSNRHVLSGEIGDGVVQPSLPDGGNALNDTVANISDFVPLNFGSTTITIIGMTFSIPNPNYVDGAIAEIIDGYNDGNREIHWVGYPHSVRRGTWSFFERLSLLNRRVCKMGRTTEFTIGKIVSVSHSTWVGPYANGRNAWFRDQVRIEGENGRFSNRGDSGSLVVDFETKKPIGLLFASSGNFTVANPIHEVLNRLNIPQI